MAPIIKSSFSNGCDADNYPTPSSSPVATRRMTKASAVHAATTDAVTARRKRAHMETAVSSDDEDGQEVRLHAVKVRGNS